MTKLPVLKPHDLFSFACPEDVRAMPERGAGHFCGSCNKTVLDLSRCTSSEAVTTLRGAKKGTCVSYAVASDGRLVFRDLAKGTIAISVAAFLAACATGEPPEIPEVRELASTSAAARTSPSSSHSANEAAGESYPSALPISEGAQPAGATVAKWPSAVAPIPSPHPSSGQPKPRPRPLAGKPAPMPRSIAGEPMPVAGTMMELE